MSVWDDELRYKQGTREELEAGIRKTPEYNRTLRAIDQALWRTPVEDTTDGIAMYIPNGVQGFADWLYKNGGCYIADYMKQEILENALLERLKQANIEIRALVE